MQLKKLLALLVSAALMLSLLAGCGNGESAVQALLKLLDGRYPNISIEIDHDLEADLRQAIRKAEAENAGDDAAVIRAALETALGSNITFRYLGDGQQGDTTFDLVFYAGSDPDKAAQAAYSQWNIVFDNVPDDGKYGTALAMVETENGVWMLVKATVEKAGTEDKPEPATVTDISVTPPTKTQYNPGDPFDPDGMTVTAHYSDGSTKTIAIQDCTLTINGTPAASYTFQTVGSVAITVKVEYQGTEYNKLVSVWVADENGYHEDNGNYVVTGTDGLQKLYNDLESAGNFTTAKITLNSSVTLDANWKGEEISFSGELNGNGNTITMEGTRTQGLFNTIALKGKVLNVDIEVNGTIENSSSYVGAVAGTNFGEISGCDVTISNGGKIDGGVYSAGGVVGQNYKTISNCTVTTEGNDAISGSGTGSVGGVVGSNNLNGTVTACYHTGTVSGSGTGSVGGVVGKNTGGGTVTACYSTGAVSGTTAGGVVGQNLGTVTACYSTGAVSGTGSAGGVVGWNYHGGKVTACYSTGDITGKYSGGVVDWNDGTVTDCYWSGSPEKGIIGGSNTSGATKVDGTDVTWQTATATMNDACNNQYSDTDADTPPKLNWEN